MRLVLCFALVLGLGCGRPPATTTAAPVIDPVRVQLDTLTEAEARKLDGHPVTATVVVAKPLDLVGGKTVVGPADRPDGIERSAVLVGKRLDADPGKRLTVSGVLLVIDHPACDVGGVPVPAWKEIRVVERDH